MFRDRTLWSGKRLREAAIQRSHLVENLNPLSCYMNIKSCGVSISLQRPQVTPFDAVIPRIGCAITFYGTAALRRFGMLGSYPLNESVAIAQGHVTNCVPCNCWRIRASTCLSRALRIHRMMPAFPSTWSVVRFWW
ncbi:hypothetical protein ACNKHL_04755 [Shigella flexneri]